MAVQLRSKIFEGSLPGPHVLITGGVHGDEFEPLAAIRQLAPVLAENIQRGKVTLVPCVNEEAFLLGRRCASDGLNLARTCPGRHDGSATEQVAAVLSELIRDADYYIDLHTGGTEFAIFPLTGYVLHADAKILEAQRKMAQAFNLPVVWGTSPNLEGRSLSVARDANVPAIYCEYAGTATCSSDGVNAYIDGCLSVMAMLEMIDWPKPAGIVAHTVEDARPGSGHLQVRHPSPVDGFFEPAVQLGEEVAAGSRLGKVVSLSDEVSHHIDSEHAGIVLMLRTFPRVRAGESVGVVLEIT